MQPRMQIWKVINIDDEEFTPILLTSQLPTQPKLEPPAASLLTSEMQSPIQLPSHYPSRVRRPPQHLAQDYLFMTVAEEHKQPPEHPYHTANQNKGIIVIGGQSLHISSLIKAQQLLRQTQNIATFTIRVSINIPISSNAMCGINTSWTHSTNRIERTSLNTSQRMREPKIRGKKLNHPIQSVGRL